MKSIEEYVKLFESEIKNENKEEFYNLIDKLLEEYDLNSLNKNNAIVSKYLEKAIETFNKPKWVEAFFWLSISEDDYYDVYSYKNKLPFSIEYNRSLEFMARASNVFADYEYTKEILLFLKDRNCTIEYKEQFDLVISPKPIKTIKIDKFYNIENIVFDDISNKKEIYFLGENGVGKSILLQAILRCLKQNEEGYFRNWHSGLEATMVGYNEPINFPYANAFAYGIGRLLTGDDAVVDNTGYATLFDEEKNAKLINPIAWLKEIDRLEKNNVGILKLENVINLLNEVLSISDGDENTKDIIVEFDKSTAEILFKEQDTNISFRQLADGYRSVLIWLSDLLKRLSELQPDVKKIEDYVGVVLIDEIDMLLHPKWEYSIVKKLREKFPKIQWFFSTHSPILILGASSDAIFYRLYKENGKTKISEVWTNDDIGNLMANSLITSPLFDLPSARMKSLGDISKLDISDNYWIGKIYEKIKYQVENEKNKVKTVLNKEAIDKLLSWAINEIDKEVDND
jgi:energy-coupling factor transporter ATP-binding protein EcfA2